MCGIKIPQQDFALKRPGGGRGGEGLCARGGRGGTLRYKYRHMFNHHCFGSFSYLNTLQSQRVWISDF